MHFNFINDFSIKFNITNAFLIPTFDSAIITYSDPKGHTQPLRLMNLFVASTIFSEHFPKFVYVKHAVSTFKTRKGDFYGCKAIVRDYNAINLLSFFTSIVIPDLKEFGYISAPNFNFTGVYTIGFSDIKRSGSFLDSNFSKISYNIGGIINFNIKNVLNKDMAKVFLSVFF